MTNITEVDRTFPSTTWAWRRVKIASPPEASSAARRSRSLKGPTVRRLPVWDWRRPLHLTITHRGGAEAWVEIHVRGCTVRVPGHMSVHDLLAYITGH